MDIIDIIPAALDAMTAAGMRPLDPAAVRIDGVLARFACEGDNPRKKNAWCVIFPYGDRPVACFGHWARNIQQSVPLGDKRPMTSLEREQARMAQAAAARKRDEELTRKHAKAAQLAKRIWNESVPAPDAHPYLQRKRIRAHDLRMHGLELVMRIRDSERNLTGLQFIRADGSKRFLPGSRLCGCYYSWGPAGDEVLLCEGFATGASLNEATGLPVAVGLFASNLVPVAKVLRGKLPHARITVCADHDDVGMDYGRQAAAAIGGHLAIPPEPGADWNDHIVKFGGAVLRDAA